MSGKNTVSYLDVRQTSKLMVKGVSGVQEDETEIDREISDNEGLSDVIAGEDGST